MTSVFTDFYRTELFNSLDRVAPIDPSQNLMNGKSVYWVYFRTYAAFTDDHDARYTAIRTISDLAAVPGWGAPLSPNSATHAIGTATAGTTTYCIDNNMFAMGGGWAPSTVAAAALVLVGTYNSVVNPVIFITDDPFPEPVSMEAADGLIARPISVIPGNRALFSWPIFVVGATQVAPTAVDTMAVLASPPDYEMAYTQHAWVYPQRVNFIANPSFEASPGTNHWRSNGTFTKVQGTASVPAAPGGGAWFGRFAGTNVVAESNTFPLTTRVQVTDQWTIQAMVRGTGTLRVGLVSWEPEFVETQVDWGPDTDVWELPPSGFLHVYALRRAYESTVGMVRLECDGTLEIDNVLCEPDWLKDWPYFDGDSTYGARDDYSWYGGENRKGKTYSLWYNHKRAVTGRLFAYDIAADDFVITDEEIEAQGYVYKWVPAGVRVLPHIDVLFPGDLQEAIIDNAGTSVTRYKTGPTDLMGVTNPWAATQYLDATVGQATTPDPGPVPAQYHFVVDVTTVVPSSGNTFRDIADQFQGPGREWRFGREMIATTGGQFGNIVYPSGTTSPVQVVLTGSTPVAVVQNKREQWAVTFDRQAASTIATLYTPATAGGWSQVQSKSAVTTALTDVTSQVRVGGFDPWQGRIYSVEMRTGLVPGQGSIIWRFDAADAPPGGTSFTDARGRVWTLTSASAIKRG